MGKDDKAIGMGYSLGKQTSLPLESLLLEDIALSSLRVLEGSLGKVQALSSAGKGWAALHWALESTVGGEG
jgi:hypothetical protein